MKIKVGKVRVVMRRASHPRLIRFANGSALLQDDGHDERPAIRSLDGGNTWKPCTPVAPISSNQSMIQLRGGMALLLDFPAVSIEGKDGWFQLQRWESDDNWETVRGPLPGQAHIPEGAAGTMEGERPTATQYINADIVALPDGALLATAYGYFKADIPPGQKEGRPGSIRSYLIKSTDRGQTWSYLSTIGAADMIQDPGLKKHLHEGFDEPSMVRLADGKLICVMRVGTYSSEGAASETYRDLSDTVFKKGRYYGPGEQKTSPLYLSASRDDGKTWTRPAPMKRACGARPRLVLLKNGILALSYGRIRRPSQDDYIIFSADGGETWTDERCIHQGLSSGYTDMVETAPGKILYVFDSLSDWIAHDPCAWIGAVDIEVRPN